MAATANQARLQAGRRIFTRILVGIDGSQQALEAARQAALLQDLDGQLKLLAAWDTAQGVGGTGTRIPYYLDEDFQRTTAEKGLRAATEYVTPYTAATTKLVRGTPVAALLAEIERDEDTLISVGSSGIGRLRGIVEGAVATELIHRAPSSVLVARQAKDGFPQRILVGVDGSVESAAAYNAARYLAERFDAELHSLVAWGGKGVDERLVTAITHGEHENRHEAPAQALTDAAERADLVIVGSRGLHGPRALGSVSERVAHSAACSALIVREPAWQSVAETHGRTQPKH
jgi:nucleotide-binding universal stress UspA family protein